MKLFLLKPDPKQPILDILSGNKQVFQGDLPNLKPFLTALPKLANAYLVPHDIQSWTSKYLNYVNQISQDKTVVFFNRSDNPKKAKVLNSISLQHTVPPGGSFSNCLIIPYNVRSLDFIERRPWLDPVVSFVGFNPRISPKRIFKSFQVSPSHPIQGNGAIIRRIGLYRLSKIPNAIVRTRASYGGAISLIQNPDCHRKEYLDSITRSDFVFSPRGDANGSQRFYEALSAGRIPVVPNTQMKLPVLGTDIQDPVFLKINTLSGNLRSSLDSFWKSMDSDTYFQIQESNRQAFKLALNFRPYLLNLLEYDSVQEWKSLMQEGAV